jgi:hypothetical protein
MGAFIYKGNIQACQIDSSTNPPVQVLSDFESSQFDNITARWLRYDRESGSFLFCAVPKASEWRYAYSFAPKSMVLTKLTDLDTYNCQWLPGGKGYAYVGNVNNHFH